MKCRELLLRRNVVNRSTAFSTCILVGILVLAAAAVPGVSIASAVGQDSTSETALTLPIAPDPSLCTIEPRSIDEFRVSSTTTDAPDSPETFVAIAAGSPADKSTVDAVTATVVEAAACINARNFLSLENLYTDAGWGGGDVDEFYFSMLAATPEPAAEGERYWIFAIALVQVLGDGRVAAVVQFAEDGVGGVDLMLFAEEGGRYLIDHWVDGPFDIEPDFSAFE
jgi:hypothetical protein